jgi:radical SAM superfamily enzyme YgiQ (UPF0313 family)
MKKIVVINSPLFKEKITNNSEDYLPPIGLGLIYSNIEKSYDVHFVDTLTGNKDLNDIINFLKTLKPHFICTNIFTTNYLLVKNIVENINIDTHWIIGGISTKSLYSEIFKWNTNNLIDIVYGDGEIVVKDIIDSIIQETPNDRTENCRYYVISPNSKYYVSNISNEFLNRSIFTEPVINHFGELEISIYTSRGCPHNCAYCVAANSRNKELGGVRRKSKEHIIEELRGIEEAHTNVCAIRILDDLFLANKNYFQDAIDIFSAFKFFWRAMCHIQSINNVEDDLLYGITQSGCKELFIGIESGSPRILNKIHKTDDISLIRKSIERVLCAGINVKGYFICGFPNETEDDLQKTIDLAATLTEYNKKYSSKFRNSTFQFRPYYGTELHDEIISNLGIPRDTILNEIKISEELNKISGYKPFNFDSGNYSNVPDDVLTQYINKMNKLNE